MQLDATTIAIVGSGYMGGGIAQVLTRAGARCVLIDTDATRAETGHGRVIADTRDHVARGYLTAEQGQAVEANLTWSGSLADGVQGADIVFEVVFEQIDVKHAVLRDIEAVVGDDVVIATNTSAIPIGDLAEALTRPERFLGVHFFNPATLLPGVEVIPHATTDPALPAHLVELLTEAGKEPAVVADTPGFVCNRLQFALFKEAARMVEDGHAGPEQIDTIVRASFGFRLALYGPFAVADMAGLDVYASSYTSLERALGERFTVPPSLAARVADGDLGIKSGGGYLGLSEAEATAMVAARDHAYSELARLRADLDGTAS
ncbi:3-hydroxyacyl-CoA dehydrogenase family protein [Agrococcus sp. Marseille-P2731]|uniref:3-hydroxyacyl-CoA dehydrogenase family protein n=1 Tax=Agrococcus sp. Marseille-P2731 TaxID=1841862 RepID=UPI0009319882|nr:3-hydroxyacyl-CoA dehydrogenase family protein [Agrococcus sp. Marseille-P2731]